MRRVLNYIVSPRGRIARLVVGAAVIGLGLGAIGGLLGLAVAVGGLVPLLVGLPARRVIEAFTD